MKRRPIIYGDDAKRDILAITDVIARDSVISAGKVLDRLETRIRTLAVLSQRGRVAPELQWHGIPTVHEIVEQPWRIRYQMTDDQILIVAVYDGRRQWQDVLMERFLRQ